MVLDGLPAGVSIDKDEILTQMARRAPGRDLASTPPQGGRPAGNSVRPAERYPHRRPFGGGDPQPQRPFRDYGNLSTLPRPGHADYTGHIRYQGANDIRGGGHFSGRLTAPLVFAGAVCRQVLARQGIETAAHIAAIGAVEDEPFPTLDIPKELMGRLSHSPLCRDTA